MPTWLTIQFILLGVWIVIGFILYQGKLWISGYPLSKKDILVLLFGYFVPTAWLISSFLYGIIYLGLLIPKAVFTGPFLGLIMLPCLALISFGYLLWKREKKRKKELQDELNAIEKVKMECQKWAEAFPFIKQENVHIQIYISKGKPAGRVNVKNVTVDQADLLKMYKDKLPEGIYLWVIPKEQNNTNQLH